MSKNKKQKRSARRNERLQEKVIQLNSLNPKYNNGEDKILYHYTKDVYLGKIYEYGIMRGDVITTRDQQQGFNAPNLTSESKFHNPSNTPDELLYAGVIRITLSVKNDEKLINYRWFDEVKCNGATAILTDKNTKKYGELDKQYIYKGAVEPSSFLKVEKYNLEEKKFETLSESQVNYIKDYYKDVEPELPDHLYLSGMKEIDWTGKYKEYCYNSIYRILYIMSDANLESFTNQKDKDAYRRLILKGFVSQKGAIINATLKYIQDKFINEVMKTDMDEDKFIKIYSEIFEINPKDFKYEIPDSETFNKINLEKSNTLQKNLENNQKLWDAKVVDKTDYTLPLCA